MKFKRRYFARLPSRREFRFRNPESGLFPVGDADIVVLVARKKRNRYASDPFSHWEKVRMRVLWATRWQEYGYEHYKDVVDSLQNRVYKDGSRPISYLASMAD